MPDTFMFDVINDKHMPKINELIINGLAVVEMDRVEQYVEQAWLCAAKDFPAGLTYDGYRHLSPQEEHHVNNNKATNNPTMEIARSDVYMVAYQLSLHGEKLKEVYLNLPIVYDGGLMRIRGSTFAICPVLADSSMSVGTDSIFVSLLRDSITFRRLGHHYYEDGLVRQSFVVWSPLHHQAKSTKAGASKPVTSLVHYLFARDGVTEVFRKYAEGTPVLVLPNEEVSEITHPPSEWVIFRSHGRPVNFGRQTSYQTSKVAMVIPRRALENEQTARTIRNLVGGFFYIADYFPFRVTADDVDEPYLWRALLGIAIFGGGGTEGRMVEQVDEHLLSLSRYVDVEARREFHEDGIPVDDLFDLMIYLIDNFTDHVITAYEHLPSMYHRRLMVLRYVMRGVVSAINTFMYRASSSGRKQLTIKDANELLKDNIGVNLILRINTNHGEVDTGVSSPGDNKFFKCTGRIVKQVNSSGQRARDFAMDDPANALHVSLAECGNYLTPSGSSPSGHERINPFVQLGPGWVLTPREDSASMFDELQRRILLTNPV